MEVKVQIYPISKLINFSFRFPLPDNVICKFLNIIKIILILLLTDLRGFQGGLKGELLDSAGIGIYIF